MGPWAIEAMVNLFQFELVGLDTQYKVLEYKGITRYGLSSEYFGIKLCFWVLEYKGIKV